MQCDVEFKLTEVTYSNADKNIFFAPLPYPWNNIEEIKKISPTVQVICRMSGLPPKLNRKLHEYYKTCDDLDECIVYSGTSAEWLEFGFELPIDVLYKDVLGICIDYFKEALEILFEKLQENEKE